MSSETANPQGLMKQWRPKKKLWEQKKTTQEFNKMSLHCIQTDKKQLRVLARRAVVSALLFNKQLKKWALATLENDNVIQNIKTAKNC